MSLDIDSDSQLSYFLKKNDDKITASIFQQYGGISQESKKDFLTFYLSFSESSYFDSGFIPVYESGLISIRKAGNHTQLVYQHAPGSYFINWNWSEGDHHTVYNVAQPYRIVIIDFVNNSFYGSRHFYSPYSISSFENVLYHTNFPNTNCCGYGSGLGVGWICIYHDSSISSLSSINEMLIAGLHKTSGSEVFNDTNMSETDGVRFYMQHITGSCLDLSEYESHEDYYDLSHDIYSHENSFLFNPILWQRKTDEDGFDWVLDHNLYIPVKVRGLDDQSDHYEGGNYLTLEMAMKGSYKSYYDDPSHLKTYNKIDRIINNSSPVYSEVNIEIDKDYIDSSIFKSFHSSISNSPLISFDNQLF
jgi:hypothetical protein